MKTLLTNPPWRKGNLYGIRASRWPFMVELQIGEKIPKYMPFPFFLAYATALLEKEKKDVFLIDALAEGLTDEEFINKVKEYNPDLFLIETSTPSIYVDLNWAKKIKEILNNVKIVLAGSHATVFSTKLLEENEYIDFVLSGEYEFTLLDLVNTIEKKGSFYKIKGLTFRDNNKIIKNEDRPLVEDINVFPWPARHFLPMYNYNDSFSSLPSPNVEIWASRGCPFQCIFCNWPKTMYGGPTYRVRDYIDVVDEIEFLIKKYKFKAFYFDDDTFNIGKERIINLSREIKKRNINIPWAIMARADTSDYETLKEMKDAGLYALKFGVESGVQEILNNSGKKLDLNKVIENTKIAKKLGIKVHLTFTFGLPGETEDTIKKTIQFAKDLDPDSVQFSIVTPFPGTPYFDILKNKGFLLTTNWEYFDGAHKSVIRTDKLSNDDLEKWLKKAIKEWTWHMFKTRLLKRPFKTLKNAIKKPYYTMVFIKNLFKDKIK